MLLVLFWLGWVGMLAGAIVIIVQAPRCKPIPEMNWWNEGPLYEIPDTQAFSDGMKGERAALRPVTAPSAIPDNGSLTGLNGARVRV